MREVRDGGTTVVLVTHLMEEAQQLCDRIADMAAGRVVAEGTPEQVVARSANSTFMSFTAPADVLAAAALSGLPGVGGVERRGGRLEVVGTDDGVLAVLHALQTRGVEPVSCLLAAIMAGITAMPAVISAYRERQVLRRIATTPARAAHVLGAQVALHAAAVLVSVVLVLAVGRLAFGVPLPAALPAWTLGYLLALVAVFGIGALVSGTAPSSRAASTVGTVVFFPLMFTAGVWYPVSAMSGLVRDVVAATPTGAAALALDRAQAGALPTLLQVLVVAGWAVVLSVPAVRCFRWQ